MKREQMVAVYKRCKNCRQNAFSHYKEKSSRDEGDLCIEFIDVEFCNNCKRKMKQNKEKSNGSF